MAKTFFVICQFFVVCCLVDDGKDLLCCLQADRKELTDGKIPDSSSVAHKPQEPLLLYLAATNQVVSAALVAQQEVNEEESEQRPIESNKDQASSEHDNEGNPKDVARKKVVQCLVYLVSSLLQGARSRYSSVQKLIFGLIMASRKLRHYFQAHEIKVDTRFPLQKIPQNPEATGRIVEWALELSSFSLKFESKPTIQSRALAEFIAE